MISFNDIVMFDGMNRSHLCSGDVPSPEPGRGARRRAERRARDAHLTDTVKQGQFRENDLKELNLS